MALCSGMAATEPQNAPFKATQLWREIITSFRAGMPRRKKRVKIRVFEECFTGQEAVEWLHFHLQTSSDFGTVSREQVLKLLQKFLDSDVIQEVRGKATKFDEEGSTLYCFVTEPGPLNFVEDMDTSSCHSSPSRRRSSPRHPRSPRRPRSPLGKHLRPRPATCTENEESESDQPMCDDDTLFTNAYAFLSDSMNEAPRTESVGSSKRGGGSKVKSEDAEETTIGSAVKKCRSDSSIESKISVIHRSMVVRRNGDTSSPSGGPSITIYGDVVRLTPAQVAGVWKELTLNRLLQLVELETLEGVLSYDAVDGKDIAKNFDTLTVRQKLAITSRASSTSNGRSLSVRGHRGGRCGHTAEVGGVGSKHPSWLNRRFGSRLSRVQPAPSPPPAANVHTSLFRSRSNNKLHPSSALSPSSSMASLTLHHKLRYSIKKHFSGERTTSKATYLPSKSLSSSSPCLAAEGGRESVMDVPNWVVLAMKCLAKWPDGCTEEFVGDMAVYCGFERDVLKSLVEYFSSLSDPLISPKLYDLHMSVLRLVDGGKPAATDALQLCSLLLPQTNRTRLHRVLRLIHKASSNRQLVLSKTKSNRDVLLEHFSAIVLKKETHTISPLQLPAFHHKGGDSGADGGSGRGKGVAKSEEERESLKRLVSFMSQHYQQIFKIPDSLRREVQNRLDLMASGKDGSPVQETRAFCHRVTSAEYEQQKQTVSNRSLVELLDSILADTTSGAKVKKQRLKQFRKAYPEIYATRVMGGATRSKTTPIGKRNSMPDLASPGTSPSRTASVATTTKATRSSRVASTSCSSSVVSCKVGKMTKGRTLSKLATNYYSTDSLATPKPVLR